MNARRSQYSSFTLKSKSTLSANKTHHKQNSMPRRQPREKEEFLLLYGSIMLSVVTLFRRVGTPYASKSLTRCFSSENNNIVENVTSSWMTNPNANQKVKGTTPPLPTRTVPDSVLKFKLSTSFDHGSAIFFPHLKMNPADFKVALNVSIDDLSLSPSQIAIFTRLVGPRFNSGRREVKLTSDRFPNRIENKRYLIMLLENLLIETRKLDEASDEEKTM